MSLDRRATVMMRTGRPGSGKTWSLVRYLVDDYLVNHQGKVFTNLPLNVEAIVQYVAGRKDERAQESLRQRLVVIPPEVGEKWLAGLETPETYFSGLHAEELAAAGLSPEEAAEGDELGIVNPLKNALVCIDEAGKMWPNRVDSATRKEITFSFVRWLRTLRHDGARIVLIVQDAKQLDASVRRLVAVELLTTNLAERREPVTGALMGDWFQILAKITRRYVTWCQEQEFVGEGDGMVLDHSFARPMHVKYFKLYNSHNREDGSTGGEEAMEWERFGILRFAWWVYQRNFFPWSLRLCLVALLWLLVAPPFAFAWRAVTWLRTDFVVLLSEQMKVKAFASPGGDGGKTSSPRATATATTPVGTTGRVTAGKKVTAESDSLALLKELEVERRLRSELEQRLGAASGLVLVDAVGVITNEGDRWNVGDTIDIGAYAGQTVLRCDSVRGRCELSSGVVLRLRRPSDGQASSPVSVVGGPVPGPGPGSPVGPEGGPPPGLRSPSEVLGAGGPAVGAGGGPGPPVGADNRGGANFDQPGSDGPAFGAVLTGSAADGSATPRR